MKPTTPHIHARDYEVRTVSIEQCYDLVQAFHYSKGGSNTATYRHGLFHRSHFMRCLGIAWWIPPTRTAAEANFPQGDWRRVLSLSRLVCEQELGTNAESFLIGRSVRLIRQDGNWDCLLTYAHTHIGHTGTIYRATNWEDMGLTKPEAVWVDILGRMVARKAGPKTRTKAEMAALGYQCIGKFPKRRFRMVLK